jgi:diguanylate cyclase (GGDEF)-like protein
MPTGPCTPNAARTPRLARCLRTSILHSALRLLIALLISGAGFAIALVSATAHAQQPDAWSRLADTQFHHYGADAGLPSPITQAIGQDGDGFLWVGTQGGLGRWDGYRFQTYQPSAAPGSIPDGLITTLHTDPRGRLWIGTSAGGLARYDRDTDRFVTYPVGPHGLANPRVTAIADADGGALWIASPGGLDLLDPETGRITAYRHNPADPDSLPGNRVSALLRDRAGALWLGIARVGLYRRNPGSGRFQAVPLGTVAANSTAIASLFQDKSGNIWIGTEPGAYVLRPADTQPRPVIETERSAFDLQADFVETISAGAPGEVWLGTVGHGIVAVNTTTGNTRRILHEPNNPSALANDTIWSIYQDRSGGVWVGSTGDLGRLEENHASILSISGSQRPHTLAEPDVESILPIFDTSHTYTHKIWFGMGTKGIDIFDLARASVTNLAPNRSRPESALPEAYIVSLFQLGDEVFIGTAKGLYRADAHGNHISRVKLPGRDPADCVYAITAVHGKLWVGGCGDGLWAFDPAAKTPQVQHFGASQLTDPRIISLAAGANSDLWIGTRNGLNRLDIASGHVTRILPNHKDPHALQCAYIPSLLLDHRGRLWLSTQGGGIEVLVGWHDGQPTFRQISAAQGLPNQNVSSLLPDAEGRIWAYTEGGVVIVDPDNFATEVLGQADGLPSSIPWDHAAAALPTGELLFGTTGVSGITLIRPEKFRAWTYQPPVVVTEVRSGGKIVPSGGLNPPASNSQIPSQSPNPIPSQSLVPSTANSLAVEFAALDYSAPENNRYAYRLDGFDDDWVKTDSSHRLAAYTNLPPGHYVLHLRGTNRNGIWAERTLDLPIRVLPAWFQTLWFRLILALGAVLCIFTLVHGRTAYLRRRHQDLERLVASRTAELEQSKRNIELLASHDPLTGLPNRRQFNTDIARLAAHADRHQQGFALLLIDLDRFKQINDTLGHDAGDALLVEAGHRLHLAVRRPDSVCRLGGDEFAILIGDLADLISEQPPLHGQVPLAPNTHQAVDAICARIVDAFAAPVAFKSSRMKTTASIGVALYREHGVTPEALYKAADLALYEAKRSGANTWRWHPAHASVAPTLTPGVIQSASHASAS